MTDTHILCIGPVNGNFRKKSFNLTLKMNISTIAEN
jgi:hypothetical protein